MDKDLSSSDVSIAGFGTVSDIDDVSDVVISDDEVINNENRLPPIPEGAIEYSSQNIAAEDIGDGPALLKVNIFEVSSNDDVLGSLDSISAPILKIVNTPELTSANPEKEFEEIRQNALSDLDEEGGASVARTRGASAPMPIKARVETVLGTAAKNYVEETIKNLEKVGVNFNPSTVQNALSDDDNEGGIVSPKSTGYSPTDGDASKDGFQNKIVKESAVVDKFRLYGFTVQFKENSSVITRNISEFFEDEETPKFSINGPKYLMKTGDSFKLVDIVSGQPELAFNDQRISIFKDNRWYKM